MSRTGSRVLLVEDNAELAENVIEILEGENYSVVHASTGAAARKLSASGFDVALIDVSLPDGTGLELLRDLKDAGDGLHEILLVTGNASIQDAIEAVKGGAYDYIIKPFRGNQLISSVDRAGRQVRASREAKVLSEEVAHRERKLRNLVDTVQALLLVLDDNGSVVQANPAVANVTGLGPDDLVGLPWIATFVPKADREEAERLFRRLLDGESWSTHENRIISADGSRERVIRWQSSSLEQPNGSRLIYASGVDVTEFMELERRTRLAERLAAVGTLAAGLAHEIRNPLNSAQLQLHLLDRRIRKQSSDRKLLEPIQLVQNEIKRLSGLVRDFLDFARPTVLNLEETNMADLVLQVVDLLRPAASENHITIECNTEDVLVTVDRAKVQQVLLNLIRNAVEAVGSNGRVVVAVEPDGTGGLVRIRDTGPGLSEEVKAHLFEPFFSTKANGTGLGMAICHSLVTQHGGDIRATSEADGAVFEVTFPKSPPIQ